jgi:CRISPR/Cas system-associated exonuclease Cas4 (RecB family)
VEPRPLIVSASQILLFSRCPYALYLKTQVKEEETPAMKTGSIFHRMVELRLKGCTKEEAIGIATQEFFSKNGHAPETLKQALQFYNTYESTLEEVAEEGVLAVEKEFYLEIDDIAIIGYIDVLTQKRKMIELKTTKQNRPLPDFKHIFQLSVYSLTDDADFYYIHYVFPDRVEKFQIQLLPRREVLTIVKSVARLLEVQEFPPLGLLTGYCQFCHFKKYCEHHRLTEKPSGGIIERKEVRP